jgi:hypothetical protein
MMLLVSPDLFGGATMFRSRSDRYRSLTTQLGDLPARALIDRLQVLALTEPNTLHEMEKFLDRGGTLGPPIMGHRQNSEPSKTPPTPQDE